VALSEPIPTCPALFAPQQRTWPATVIPQVVKNPDWTTANLAEPATGCGVRARFLVPLPSWPELLSPQQKSLPSSTTPQVRADLALNAENRALVATRTGVRTGLVGGLIVPMPS
jgi:hypothetical protein